jgi:allantoicase
MAAFTELVDLAAERVGGRALYATDDFFAEKENLLKPGRGEWIAGKYTDRGKWMDGWESRRKRVPGHDWCTIQLGLPGVIRGFDVDTNFFTGNYPQACSIDACEWNDAAPLDPERAAWTELVGFYPLNGGSQHLIEVSNEARWTHLRLHIYPDGGVARLRAYGLAAPDVAALAAQGVPVDVASVLNGAAVVEVSDDYFGSRHNLIMPGRSINMGDGWETRRKRRATFDQLINDADWLVLRLCAPATLTRIEVDTEHFKGNFPDSCLIEGALVDENRLVSWEGAAWKTVVPRTKLSASNLQVLAPEVLNVGPYSHLRISIFPDGGIARLRAWGILSAGSESAAHVAAVKLLNDLKPAEATEALKRVCGSQHWAEAMAASRPFASARALHAHADRVWWSLGQSDWLEAFTHHPRIGSRDALREKFAATRTWAEGEQARVTSASEETVTALLEANEEHERRYGFIFIVCATGRSADEMLAILRGRLTNDDMRELRESAIEENKITHLRLKKLLEE